MIHARDMSRKKQRKKIKKAKRIDLWRSRERRGRKGQAGWLRVFCC